MANGEDDAYTGSGMSEDLIDEFEALLQKALDSGVTTESIIEVLEAKADELQEELDAGEADEPEDVEVDEISEADDDTDAKDI